MFHDREDAGRRLADGFRGRKLHDPLVLAIPRGGVVTGAVLAKRLWAELDVVLSRKLRAPGQPEAALGAIGEDGRVYLDRISPDLVDDLEEYLAAEQQYQFSEMERRKKLFRAVRPPAAVAGRSVIVTDDGIATGSTMIAALQSVRPRNPRELIVAVPVASPDRLEEVHRWCDEIICPRRPAAFWAIGQFYENFRPVEDAEAVELLRAARAETRAAVPSP